MEANRIKTKTLIISLASIIALEWALRLVLSRHRFDPMIILGTARFLEIILISLILVKTGKGVSSIGLASSQIMPGLRRGFIWSAGFGIVAFLTYLILYVAGVNALILIQSRLPAKPGEIILFFFIAGMLGPVGEEIFFRGILYGFFRRWGTLSAVTLSTLLFVAAHSTSQGLLFPQVVGGIVFALAYEVEGNLLVPITIHVLGNIAIFSLSLIN